MILLVTVVLASLAPFVLGHTYASNSTFLAQFKHHDKNGAVASEASECSRVGIELLKEGGNAADAVGPFIEH